MSVISDILHFFGKVLHAFKVSVAPLVVGALELIQKEEDSGLLPGLSKLIDSATGGKGAETINADLKAALPNAIAFFFGVEGLPANPTEQQEKDFSAAILNAFVSKKAQQTVPGKVISALGVEIYDLIKKIAAEHADGSAVTAAEITGAVEKAYQYYVAALSAAQDPNQ